MKRFSLKKVIVAQCIVAQCIVAQCIVASLACVSLFFSCQPRQTLDEKAEQDVREYNRRYCPTPAINYIRTDSITFDASRHTFTYHCSLCDLLDDKGIVALNKERITNTLRNGVKHSTSMRTYVESGYRFHYICHSDSDPTTILFDLAF
ncbi:MAG: hypothetical protein IKO82_00870 [Prevotella sp.]|nr:hypothetical protein [Prevotella sp.]